MCFILIYLLFKALKHTTHATDMGRFGDESSTTTTQGLEKGFTVVALQNEFDIDRL